MQLTHNKGRLEQFSDGVFAIAITLLALELKVPTLTHSDIPGAIKELWPLIPNILTFLISFMTIAIFWVNHHQLTQSLGSIRRRVIWTNVLTLLFVTLIPLGTEIASTNVLHPLAVIGYGLILLGGSVSFSILRYFVHRGEGETHIPMGRSIMGPVIYFLAILTAPFSVWLSYAFLAIPPLFYFLPKAHSEERSS